MNSLEQRVPVFSLHKDHDDDTMMGGFHDEVVTRSASVIYAKQDRALSFDSSVISECIQSASSELSSVQVTMEDDYTEEQLQAATHHLSIHREQTRFKSLAHHFPLSDVRQSQAIGRKNTRNAIYSSSYPQRGQHLATCDENQANLQAICNLTERTSTFVDELLGDPEATVRQGEENQLTKSTALDLTALHLKNEMTEINYPQGHMKYAQEEYRLDWTTWQMEEMQQIQRELIQHSRERYQKLKNNQNQWGCLFDRNGVVCFRPGERRHAIMSEQRFHQANLRKVLQRGGDATWFQRRISECQKYEEARHKQALTLARLEIDSVFSAFPILGNRFILIQLLGRGGNGEVWDVLDYANGKCRCALKISSLYDHAQKEHRTHRELEHENIVNVGSSIYCLEFNGKIFAAFTIDLVDMDLHRLIDLRGKLDEGTALTILLALMKALAYLHRQRGIAHYDLKPSNILISDEMQVKLTDFDLARNIHAPIVSHHEGTLKYLPPETFTDSFGTAEKADIWMIGVIYHMMLTGKHPLYCDKVTLKEIQCISLRYRGAILPQAQDSGSQLSDLSKWILCECLRKEPIHRPTAHELFQALLNAHSQACAP
uniref:Protein kinase putative n=1 Tax=Albugo laibachii Nc14 TaxID=890382 RepID=F0WBM0_9STRA|nr:protein kinase putative [Albugo laibachii Nc14]|eukprot:CCA18547.1 protein kinase putative [Albugo laibachii Nc14]